MLEALRLTPFARREFLDAYEPTEDSIERARRLVIKSLMGHGSDGATQDRFVTGFRANSNRSGTTPAHDWMTYPDALPLLIERLRGVVIEQRDALEVCLKHDSEATLFYVDPPYLPETRKIDHRHHGYRHEMSPAAHHALLAALHDLKGMVVLSGYRAPLYDRLLGNWERREIDTFADGGRPRRECLWLNPACAAALGHGPLFEAFA